MPSIAASQKYDRSRLKKAEATETMATNAAQISPPPAASGLSPLFICSLPRVGASFDQLGRQFYNVETLQQRIFPPGVE